MHHLEEVDDMSLRSVEYVVFDEVEYVVFDEADSLFSMGFVLILHYFSLQVGACLVSQDGIILGIAYNGFPRCCSDDKLPWSKKSKNGDPLEKKYPYACHAEVNCILNTNHASAAGQVFIHDGSR